MKAWWIVIVTLPLFGKTQPPDRAFNAFFTDSTAAFVSDFVSSIKTIETDEDFQHLYHEGKVVLNLLQQECDYPQTSYHKSLYKSESDPIYAALDQLDDFNGKVGPIYFSCTAECTEFDLVFDLKYLFEVATRTKGKADDAFMQLLIAVDGDQGYAGHFDFKAWDVQYWDYGGSNVLGDGTITRILKQLMKYKKGFRLFHEEIEMIHTEIAEMLASRHSYEYSLDEVLKEYEIILRLNYFNNQELDAIQRQFEHLKTNTSEYQFNCKQGGCSFG